MVDGPVERFDPFGGEDEHKLPGSMKILVICLF